MGCLGNRFPADYRHQSAARQLIPGRILYIYCDFTDPPKNKYLVVACVEPKLLVFVINSDIPPFARSNPDLLACQLELCASDNSFLHHNSYINCGEVEYSLDKDEIMQQISTDMDRVKGELAVAIKKDIVRIVQTARTISRKYAEWISNALDPS